jgi:hypothetical protein
VVMEIILRSEEDSAHILAKWLMVVFSQHYMMCLQLFVQPAGTRSWWKRKKDKVE